MKNKKQNIDAIIIYSPKNVNKELLKRTEKSLLWCNKIIKFDTTKVQGSFSEWRNVALKQSQSEWVLYVDSDELISENLKIEICKLIENWKSKIGNFAYAIPRKNIIFGQEFKYGGQWPDYQKRLFKRSAFKHWVGSVHEEPIFEGEIGHIISPLIHYKNITISQMLEKTNEWSELEAKLLFDAKHPKMNALRFFSAFLREFYLRFIKQLSFLDGTKGIIYGIYQIYSRLITYSKLWEMQIKHEGSNL